MKRSVPLILGFILVATCADSALAQRRGNAGVNSAYGQFSAAEMQAAGGDPAMASQLREQKMMFQYQQQMYKQQQQYMQQMTKQQQFLKQHPEAAKALNSTPAKTTKKSTAKTGKKGQSAAKEATEPETEPKDADAKKAPATAKTPAKSATAAKTKKSS